MEIKNRFKYWICERGKFWGSVVLGLVVFIAALLVGIPFSEIILYILVNGFMPALPYWVILIINICSISFILMISVRLWKSICPYNEKGEKDEDK